MGVPVIQTSFAGGILSRSLFARVDLDKYHIGAEQIFNWFVDYRGGVSTRPGTAFVDRARGNGTVRLWPFQVSTTQAYLLVFTDLNLRIYIGGSPLIDATRTISAITKANPGVITVDAPVPAGKWLRLSSIGGMTQLNGRTVVAANPAGNTFEICDEDGNNINTTGYTTYTGGGIAQRYLDIATPYIDADLRLLKFTQSADVLTITHPSYPPYDLVRYSASSFMLAATSFDLPHARAFTLNLDVSDTGATNTVRYGYTVCSVLDDGTELDCLALTDPPYGTVSSPVLNPNMADPDPPRIIKLTWRSEGARIRFYRVYKFGPVSDVPTEAPDDTVFGYIGTAYSGSFTDNNIAPDFSKTPPRIFNPFSPGQILSIQVDNPGSGFTGSYQPATVTGDGTGARLYGVADPATGKLVAIVLMDGGKNYTTATLVCGSATALFSFAPMTGVYPSCCSYFQQRRAYAATIYAPDTIFLSAVGNYIDFTRSVVARDDSAIQLTIASGQVNDIKSLVSMQTGLIAFTSGQAFLINAGGQTEAITPTNMVAASQASTGANDLPPLVINYDVLFVQNKGATVRDLQYSLYTQSYYGFDRSALASHLFDGHQITDWTYSEEPFRLVHAVQDNGDILAMTYVPEQEIYAWSQWSTNPGLFESVASVSEPNVNAVYTVVSRFTGKKFIERFADRAFSNVAQDYWTVDCGLNYSGTAKTKIVGLWHLIGQTVVGLADGMIVSDRVVAADGSVTLDVAAADVTLGIGFTARLKTLNLDLGDPTVQSKRKLITGLTIRVNNTRGLEAGPTFVDSLVVKELAVPYTPPQPLVSNDQRILLRNVWNTEGQVCVIQRLPLPATVLGLIPEVIIGDTAR